MPDVDTVIVGAGVCGLTIARGLTQRGQRVLVVDKARRPGGRLSSRPMGGALLDVGPTDLPGHGLEVLREAESETGLDVSAFTVHDGRLGWDRPASAIATAWADGLDLRVGLATHLEREHDGSVTVVLHGGGAHCTGTHVVLTPPAPQVAHLLATSGLPVPEPVAASAYEMRMVLIVHVADAAAVSRPADAGFLSVGATAPVGDGRVLTLVASADWSARAWSQDVVLTEAQMLVELAHLYPTAFVEQSTLKRWRYANPVTGIAAPHLRLDDPAGVVVAGDAFATVDAEAGGFERALRSALSVVSALG